MINIFYKNVRKCKATQKINFQRKCQNYNLGEICLFFNRKKIHIQILIEFEMQLKNDMKI